MQETSESIKGNSNLIWNTLNNKAKKTLPTGIVEFLETGEEYAIENGKEIFLIVDNYLDKLIKKSNSIDAHNAYRREISSVKDEKQLSELFSEIAVCPTISNISSSITLKPLSNPPKRCNFKSKVSYYEIYGEVKRYEDKNSFSSRSVLSDDNHKFKTKTSRPRFLELSSKLDKVYKQLSTNRINILFIFRILQLEILQNILSKHCR